MGVSEQDSSNLRESLSSLVSLYDRSTEMENFSEAWINAIERAKAALVEAQSSPRAGSEVELFDRVQVLRKELEPYLSRAFTTPTELLAIDCILQSALAAATAERTPPHNLTEHQKAVEEAAGMPLDWGMANGYEVGRADRQPPAAASNTFTVDASGNSPYIAPSAAAKLDAPPAKKSVRYCGHEVEVGKACPECAPQSKETK